METKINEIFRHFSKKASDYAGSFWSFCGALLVVITWATTGPIFGFSDTWQLVINTGTTIITFLMVFIIQNTQNRDSKAIHIKLDELIRVSKARNGIIDVEDLSDEQLKTLHDQFVALEKKGRKTGSPGRKTRRKAGEPPVEVPH